MHKAGVEDDLGIAQPTHLFCATADGPGGFRNATRTWNMALPLRQELHRVSQREGEGN